MERTGSSANVSPAIAVGAWELLEVAELVAEDDVAVVDLVGGLDAAFVLDLVAVVAFLGAVAAVFFAGLPPVPGLVFELAVSRETSGIKAPKPRPKLCRFAITLTLLFTFGDFSRCC